MPQPTWVWLLTTSLYDHCEVEETFIMQCDTHAGSGNTNMMSTNTIHFLLFSHPKGSPIYWPGTWSIEWSVLHVLYWGCYSNITLLLTHVSTGTTCNSTQKGPGPPERWTLLKVGIGTYCHGATIPIFFSLFNRKKWHDTNDFKLVVVMTMSSLYSNGLHIHQILID